MATQVQPRFAAQLQNMPLAVITGIDGYGLRYEGGAASMVIRDQSDWCNDPLEFDSPHEAYRIMREAQGVTAALLAGVFGRAVS